MTYDQLDELARLREAALNEARPLGERLDAAVSRLRCVVEILLEEDEGVNDVGR